MKTSGRGQRETRRLVLVGLTTGVLALGAVGCKSKETAAPIVGPDGGDPAAANMAQPYTGGNTGGYSTVGSAATGATGGKVKVLSSQEVYQGQANGQDYGDPYGQSYGQGNPAPIIRQAPAEGSGDPNAAQGGYDQGYSDAEEAGEQALAEADQPPPPLPEYDQPPAPDPNYLWTPGYYDYASAGYYWVPGAWVAPPYYGALWTPSWWGFYGGHYLFHRGYWGSHVGFYGGVNYGFGYIGTGYYGGYWRGHDFFYNRAVTNVNTGHIHNVYDRTVVFNNRTYGARPNDRVDFNGGPGGLQARPNASELGALHEAHYAPVAAQRENRVAAASNRSQFVRADGGRPAMAFAAHPIGNAGNIANVPREQPLNHPATPGVIGRPEAGGAFNNGRGATDNAHLTARAEGRGEGALAGPANRGFNGAAGRPETGHPVPGQAEPGARQGAFVGPANRGFNGAAGRPETGHPVPGQAEPGARQGEYGTQVRPGFTEGRNAPGDVRGGGFNGQRQPYANVQRSANPAHTPAAGAPQGRFNAEPQRQAEQAPRSAPPERQAAPVQRQTAPSFHPEATPAARPEAAPMQRSAPAAVPQRSMPEPHAAPAPTPHPGGGGGAEHGGHR